MTKTNKYILNSFSTIFFPIFFTLFSITSIIAFIKIASASSILKINFTELVLMYGYMLPMILFFTIPIVFFASSVVSLVKLSLDSELIVLFSLGISPNELVKIYAKLAILVSLVLFVLSLGLIPIAKQLNKVFIENKKANVSLNISSTDFGQKFADWYIFSQKDTKTNFSNIVLFSEQSYDNFIFAKSAESQNSNGNLQLSLYDGKAYFIKENELNQIVFKNMVINNAPKTKLIEYNDLVEYWSQSISDKKRLKDLVTYMLISIFPVLSIFLIVTFGVVNPRFTKNRSNLYMILSILIYFILVFSLVSKTPFAMLFLIPIFWIIVSYSIYKKYTLQRF